MLTRCDDSSSGVLATTIKRWTVALLDPFGIEKPIIGFPAAFEKKMLLISHPRSVLDQQTMSTHIHMGPGFAPMTEKMLNGNDNNVTALDAACSFFEEWPPKGHHQTIIIEWNFSSVGRRNTNFLV